MSRGQIIVDKLRSREQLDLGSTEVNFSRFRARTMQTIYIIQYIHRQLRIQTSLFISFKTFLQTFDSNHSSLSFSFQVPDIRVRIYQFDDIKSKLLKAPDIFRCFHRCLATNSTHDVVCYIHICLCMYY